MSAASIRWSCARCNVSAGQIDGLPTALPTTWMQVDGETYCLVCSRALVGEAAMDAAPSASSREERVRLRREAVVEFEIGRVPLAPNRVIAHSCRTSLHTVVTARRALDQASSENSPGAPVGR
jgi:uncharacterized Zn finger protein (UPF0148 family)